MGDETKDLKSSGDAEEEVSIPEKVEPPPKIPDVELIVDGFGFMPHEPVLIDTKKKSKAKEQPDVDVGSKSTCSSATTNINIVRRYTWKTKNRMTVQVISYGATITSISVPDRKGVPDDVVAGFETLEEYMQPNNPYFGATIGRYANMIRNATMLVKPSGRTYMLSTNRGHHHYNGGYQGFDKVNWRSYVSGEKVIMSHISDRFSEGYPGSVLVQICFEVTCDNTIKIEMKCTTSEPTIINLSISPYFNLAGHHAGVDTMLDHIFTINGDKYTAVDDDGLTTGEKKVVGGTAFDFRVPRLLRSMISKVPLGGYDINYCITKGTEQDVAFQARALHPQSGRVLEVYSNQPGMQFYTGNQLPDPDKIVEEPKPGEENEEHSESEASDESESESDASSEHASHIEEAGGEAEGVQGVGYVPLQGKGGTNYRRHGLFSLMPQNYPDAINNRHFPNSVLNPGEVYAHRIQFKFGILLGKYF